MKIIQIDGVKGLITAIFVCACAFAGFVISPGFVAMSLWNKYLAETYMFPTLSIFQGVLLWGIVVITYLIVSKNGFALSFKNTPELSEEELNSIIKSAKLNAKRRMMNRIVTQKDKVDLSVRTKDMTSGEDKETSLVSTPANFANTKSNANTEEDSVSKIK